MTQFYVVKVEVRSDYSPDWGVYNERSWKNILQAREYAASLKRMYLRGFSGHAPENVRVRIYTCEVIGWELIE